MVCIMGTLPRCAPKSCPRPRPEVYILFYPPHTFTCGREWLPTGVRELTSLTRASISVVVSFLYSSKSALTSWTWPLVAGRSLSTLFKAAVVALLWRFPRPLGAPAAAAEVLVTVLILSAEDTSLHLQNTQHLVSATPLISLCSGRNLYRTGHMAEWGPSRRAFCTLEVSLSGPQNRQDEE